MSPSSRCPIASRLRARVRLLAELSLCDLVALFASRLDFEIVYPDACRERLFTPLRTFWLFLAQALSADGTCREAVRGALGWLCFSGAGAASPSTSAYCQARARMSEGWLTAISQRLIKQLESRTPEAWLWRGHPVKLVDGSSVSMPDTPANQARWPQPSRQRAGCGFPVARVLGVFSLATGALLALIHGSLHDHERTMFRRLFDQVFRPGDVALGDRGFCGFAEYHELTRRGVHCVMRRHARLQEGAGLRNLKRLGRGDVLMEWRRSNVASAGYTKEQWKALAETLTIRQITVRFEDKGFRTKTVAILTTLLDEKAYPAEAFAALYRRRWQVELDLRDIKTTLGMDVLRCKTPAMIQKELVIYHILYNTIRGILSEAAVAHGTAPERLSFKGTVSAARQWAGVIAHAGTDEETARLHNEFLRLVARDRVPLRPGRAEPRATKRRPKQYSFLTHPRRDYKEIPHRNRYRATARPLATERTDSKGKRDRQKKG